MAVSDDGVAYLAGGSTSKKFPRGPKGQRFANKGGFLAKLSSSGSALVYAVSGFNGIVRDAAIDAQNNPVGVGSAIWDLAATANAFQTMPAGSEDAFVFKLNARGKIEYLTYLGGTANDWASHVTVGRDGDVYVTGSTESVDFPTAKPLQASYGPIRDAFVARLTADLSQLIFSSYLGGSGLDEGHGVAVDSRGGLVVVGGTRARDFPTSRPLQSAPGGSDIYDFDCFISRLHQ